MLISILIPCYNSERWIAQAIESALEQTWTEKEVIVLDDGSTDASLEVIRKFGDRIQFEATPNCGANPARNRLLELSRGEWLQYLDADDFLLPDKIEKQVEFIAIHQDIDVVFGPVTLEHWSEKETYQEFLKIPEPHDMWVLLARWYLPQTGSPLWRKRALVDVGKWTLDQPCCQEHELYLRLLMAGKHLAYCASNGAVYRQWGEHTLCKRDKSRVRHRRLEIEQRTEMFLRQRDELTSARHWAINQARFEMARTAWQQDPAEAHAIIGTIQQSQPGFIPAGEAAPRQYQMIYRLLGFGPTERLADLRRKFGWESKR